MPQRIQRLWLAGLLLLAACAGPGQPPRRSVSLMVFGDPAELAAYQELVAAFEQRQPAIDVALRHVPDQADYRVRLGVDFAANTAADVVLINYRRYAPFAARGLLEPLGPYLERSALIAEDDFYPQAMAPFRWQGQLMCLPQNISSLVVYFNATLFDQAGVPYPRPGWSWDDFLRAAQALTRDHDGDGVADQHGVGVEPSIFRVAPFIWQQGGQLTDDPQQPTRLTLDTPAATAALRWFVELQTVHRVIPDKVAERAEDYETRWLNGRLGMIFNSRRGVPTYRQISAFDWDVAPLPTAGQPASILHADAYCMAATTADKDAAWLLVEFANSIEGQRIVARSGRTVPSLPAVAESPAFLDPNMRPASSHVFLEAIPHVRAVPVARQWPLVEDMVQVELERAFYGDVPLARAVAQAQARAAQLFADE